MENKRDEKCLDFVVNNYKTNRFNAEKALEKFNKNKRPRRLHPAIWIVAASLVIGAFTLTHFIVKPKSEWVTITATNETLNYILPDSSVVTLSKNSSISFDANAYAKKVRHINMSGKVYYDVRKNREIPFEVWAKVAKVRVLGTEFQVNENEETTDVYVNSGKVLFTAIGSKNSVTLTKGMFAELTSETQTPKITEQITINPAVWANGVFVYKNTLISDVLVELSAFYKVKLHTEHTSKQLTATFKADSLEEIIELIEQVLNIKIIITK